MLDARRTQFSIVSGTAITRVSSAGTQPRSVGDVQVRPPADVIVTERRCGVAEDVLGCTLYKSSRRLRRHFIDGATTHTRRNVSKCARRQAAVGGRRDADATRERAADSHTRREAALFVEVCTEGCEEDGCVSVAVGRAPLASLLLALLATADARAARAAR